MFNHITMNDNWICFFYFILSLGTRWKKEIKVKKILVMKMVEINESI